MVLRKVYVSTFLLLLLCLIKLVPHNGYLDGTSGVYSIFQFEKSILDKDVKKWVLIHTIKFPLFGYVPKN